MGPTSSEPGDEAPVYVISVVSRLVSLHPQTIRQYERMGLLRPCRSSGNTRLFSRRDVDRLRQIAELKGRGVSLPGIAIICDLLERLELAQREVRDLRRASEAV